MSGCALRHAVELSGTTAPHSSENPFEKGQSDEFQLMLPIIGTKVLSATLSIDSKGVGSNWFVDDVTVGIFSLFVTVPSSLLPIPAAAWMAAQLTDIAPRPKPRPLRSGPPVAPTMATAMTALAACRHDRL